MKIFYAAMLVCVVGCSSEKSNDSAMTLRGMAYVDMFASGYMTEHPLLTIDYYPGGAEMIFKQPGQAGEVHAIFPKCVTPPQKDGLAKPLTLHGRFETLENKTQQKPMVRIKRVSPNYRYFLVSSWECSK